MAALALGAGVVACSSSESGGTTTSADAGPTSPATDASPGGNADTSTPAGGVEAAVAFRTEVAKAVCAKLAGCCSEADRKAYFDQYREKPYELTAAPSDADCESVLSQTLGKLHGKWTGSIERGAIAFDANKAKSCVEMVKSAACGVPLATAFFGDNGCWGPRGKVFLKKRAIGEACDDIGDGTFYGECDPAQGFCGNKSKKCEPWKQPGEECQVVGTWAFCAPSLNCDGGTPTKPGKCSGAPVTVAIGQTCTALSGPTTLCGADAFCNFTSGKCEAKKADGASCKYDDECQTSHPFSCSPFNAGTCGQKSFCAKGS